MPHTSIQWCIAFSMSRTTIPTWRIGPNKRLIAAPPRSVNQDCDPEFGNRQAGGAIDRDAALPYLIARRYYSPRLHALSSFFRVVGCVAGLPHRAGGRCAASDLSESRADHRQ